MFGHCTRNYIEVPVLKSDGSEMMVPIPSWSWAVWEAIEGTHVSDLTDTEGNIVRPVIQLHIVDDEHKLAGIKEQSWQLQDNADNQIRPSWRNAQHHIPQFLQTHSPSQIGQLHFWTSYANVRAIRTWIMGGRVPDYARLQLYPDFQPDLDVTSDRSEIVYQDFIVVAARGEMLILLAIEWKDGIAYRVGKTEIPEAEWAQVKNREWRLITLG